MHNVLKGVRSLSPELGDHVLRRLEIGVLDLLQLSELEDEVTMRMRGGHVTEVDLTEFGRMLSGRKT